MGELVLQLLNLLQDLGFLCGHIPRLALPTSYVRSTLVVSDTRGCLQQAHETGCECWGSFACATYAEVSCVHDVNITREVERYRLRTVQHCVHRSRLN
jgi:hypothetical protein